VKKKKQNKIIALYMLPENKSIIRKKQYEKDRELKFIDSWKQDRPWLHHNVEQNVIVCNWCIEANGPKELYIYILVIKCSELTTIVNEENSIE
jgi:hypothetical protein